MLKLENVSKYYHNDGIVTLGLNKINLEFKIGEFVAITGESGSGKSTLLNVVSGIDSYEDGEFYINGEETSHYDYNDWEYYRNAYIGFIFQNYNLIDSYTVLKNVEVAMVGLGINKSTRRIRAIEIIKKVGLQNHIKHRASKLSGGQKQRLAIARALAKNTQIIVADEPTGNLDSESGRQVLELLNEIAKDKLVIIVTHNYEQVSPYVSRKIRLFNGEVVEDKSIKNINENNLHKKEEQQISNFNKVATVSFFNIFGQPRKSILLFLVTLVSVFFIFIIYGYFNRIAVEGNQPNYYYDGGYNNYKERLIVTRRDKLAMNDADYNYLSKLSDVDLVIKESLALDIMINMQYYNQSNKGEISFYQTGYINNAKAVGDINGRLPEKDNEIFISIGQYTFNPDFFTLSSLLNKEVDLFINGMSNELLKRYTIVGYEVLEDEFQTTFKISDNEFMNLYNLIKISYQEYEIKSTFYNGYNIEYIKAIAIDDTLTGMQISYGYLRTGADAYYINDMRVELVSKQENNLDYFLYVSTELYNKLIVKEDYQYSLNLKDYTKADDLSKKLFANGYNAFSPGQTTRMYNGDIIGDVVYKIFINIAKYFTIFVMYLITYMIIRTIMSSKVRDYTILRSIGFEKKRIKQIIKFEIIFVYLVAYLIDLIIFILLAYFSPKTFSNAIKGIRLNDIILLTIIYLIISLLTSRKFNKMLDKKSLLNNLKVE